MRYVKVRGVYYPLHAFEALAYLASLVSQCDAEFIDDNSNLAMLSLQVFEYGDKLSTQLCVTACDGQQFVVDALRVLCFLFHDCSVSLSQL